MSTQIRVQPSNKLTEDSIVTLPEEKTSDEVKTQANVLETSEYRSQMVNLLAVLRAAQGQCDEAQAALAEALRTAIESAEQALVHYKLFQLALQELDQDAAFEHLIKTADLDPQQRQDAATFLRALLDLATPAPTLAPTTQGQTGQRFRDHLRDGGEGPEMVVIPAGSFQMGDLSGEGDDDEGPIHGVRFDQPFALGVYAVTFDEYDRFAHSSGRGLPDDRGWGRERRPVINVSWEDAVAYCAWLSEKTGEAYRLPSEAEWEYACRAGTTTEYFWGDAAGHNKANFRGSGSQWGGEQTAPVGSFAPNPWGLYDMHGNVYEWCADCWHGDYKGAPSDGGAWMSGGDCDKRVLRGGSWYFVEQDVRAAFRFTITSSLRFSNFGFRVARTLP